MDHLELNSLRPIIIVTGANRGIGLGICRRLLQQLCTGSPTDSAPNARHASGKQWKFWRDCKALTLIMACRNSERGHAARKDLLDQFDLDISGLKEQVEIERAKKFREHLTIEVAVVDLTEAASVLEFTAWTREKFTYISHLILNAGIAQFIGVRVLPAIKQVITSPSSAVRTPRYLKERVGQKTDSGIGLVWHSNVLGHYIMVRTLARISIGRMPKGPGNFISRYMDVVFVNFLNPGVYNSEDIQLVASQRPYPDSKYQIELLAAPLNRSKVKGHINGTFHLIVEPGILATGLDQSNNRGLARVLRTLTFVTARLLNSHSFPTSTYEAAISATHAALMDTEAIENRLIPLNKGGEEAQIKLHSRAPFKRKAYVSYEESLRLDALSSARGLIY